MKIMVFEDNEKLVEELRGNGHPFHGVVVAIDGLSGSGKSTLARFLAWRLGIPTIETDLFLNPKKGFYDLRFDELRSAITTRTNRNCAVIVEGVLLLHTLKQIEIDAGILIYVRKVPAPFKSLVLTGMEDYLREFSPEDQAKYVYEWKEDSLAS